MSYLLHVLLALGTLATYELDLADEPGRPWLLLVLPFVPHGLGALAQRAFRRGHVRRGALLERLLIRLAPLLQFVAILTAGWIPRVEGWTGLQASLGDWSGLGVLLGIVPYLALEVLVIDARLRLYEAPRGARAFQLRLLASSLLPIVLYLAFATLIGTQERLRVHIQTVALFEVGYLALLLIAMVLFLPLLLRYTWGTEPVPPGWQRTVLEELARRAKFRSRGLLRWNTGYQMANAAILGVTPWTRIVVFSDALLRQLGPRELAAVFAHEMGHARRSHALVFGAFTVGFFLSGDAVARLPFFDGPRFEGPWFEGGLLLTILLAWFVCFGWVSRRFELEADLEALELLGETESLAAALRQVSAGHGAERSSWRHFSTALRLEFLERVQADPTVAARLRRKLRWIARLSVALFLGTVGLQVSDLARSVTPDRIVAELRLGEYARAVELGVAVEPSDKLGGFLALASEPDLPREPERLEEKARVELHRGNLARAWILIELAELRGGRDLGVIRDALAARSDPEKPPAAGLPGDLDEDWAAALRAFDRR